MRSPLRSSSAGRMVPRLNLVLLMREKEPQAFDPAIAVGVDPGWQSGPEMSLDHPLRNFLCRHRSCSGLSNESHTRGGFV